MEKQPVQSLPCLLLTIDKLTLAKFIHCSTTNDLTQLIDTGTATDAELEIHFNDIKIAFADLKESKNTLHFSNIQKQIVKLTYKIQFVATMLSVYFISKSDVLKKLISKQGFYFDATHTEELITKKFEGYCTNISIDIANKNKELQNLLGEDNGAKPTRESFINDIIQLTKEGYKIDIDTTMTDVYALSIKSYTQFLEAKQKQLTQANNGEY